MPMLWSLFGFRMGRIVARFQRLGVVLVFRAMLYMFVRCLSVFYVLVFT